MPSRISNLIAPGLLLASSLSVVVLGFWRPGYLTDAYYLGAVIILQILIAALWNYRQRFFVLLMLIFFWAGMPLSLASVWTSGRWYVLALGTLVGFVIYMKDQRHYFATFHLVAFICLLSALVSAVVSAYPQLALLKVLSLVLLFGYGAAGGRLAGLGNERKFVRGLLTACEAGTYITAASYFLLHFDLFDSPNSLGAVMGVVAVPFLLWGVLASEGQTRLRLALATGVALLLLLSSYSRAGILSALIACFLVCAASRNYRTMAKGTAFVLLAATLAIFIRPLESKERGFDTDSDSLTTVYLYKGRRTEGMFGSRRSVWDETTAAIQAHPWFGTGFGTSAVSGEASYTPMFSSSAQTTREHGNSYLAIVEWTGLLGVLPFLALVLLVGLYVKRVFRWLRNDGQVVSPIVPLAAVLAAGLVDTVFEDWLFAPGYYLCLLFWVLAFLLVDMLPAIQPARAPVLLRWTRPRPERWQPGIPAAGR
ncbi:MAG: O-antigen ligase family protein [Acidobacteria bacterium]|nr:O-antigen ligase family protein [Acidobacteriota bacterium]